MGTISVIYFSELVLTAECKILYFILHVLYHITKYAFICINVPL